MTRFDLSGKLVTAVFGPQLIQNYLVLLTVCVITVNVVKQMVCKNERIDSRSIRRSVPGTRGF